jgi:hypothetical protein
LDGTSFKGSFADGRFDGSGTLVGSAERWRFEGSFRDGQIIKGRFFDEDGQAVRYIYGEAADTLIGRDWEYQGGFGERGQNGSGTFTFPDGSVYTGDFVRGFAEGTGAYISAAGTLIYEGEFKEGRFEGQGRYYSPEGWIYEGGFKEGLFDGEGTFSNETETVRGVWERGVQISRYE